MNYEEVDYYAPQYLGTDLQTHYYLSTDFIMSRSNTHAAGFLDVYNHVQRVMLLLTCM